METVAGEGVVVRVIGRSPTIGALAGALALAQGEMKGATKDRENPFFRSKYADLGRVWDACREPLSKNALAVIQLVQAPDKIDGGLYEDRAVVDTLLAHSSGEWVETRTSLPVLGPELKGGGRGPVNAQSYGSAITYARRYALAAIAGVYQEDDDGNAASKQPEEEQTTLPEERRAELIAEINKANTQDELKKAWANAYRAANNGNDQAALKTLSDVKDARKKAIEEKSRQFDLTPPPSA